MSEIDKEIGRELKGEFREKQNEKLSPDDFYIEKGFTVFTEKYLLKRGYCCESNCRHCPYGFKEK